MASQPRRPVSILGKQPFRIIRKRWVDNVSFDLRKVNCDGGRLAKLAHNHVQWQAFVVTVLGLHILLHGLTLLSSLFLRALSNNSRRCRRFVPSLKNL
jgi:hypothetical protein